MKKVDGSVILLGMPVALWAYVTREVRQDGHEPMTSQEHRPQVVCRDGRVVDYHDVSSNMTFLAICPPETDWHKVAAAAYEHLANGLIPIPEAPDVMADGALPVERNN